MQVHPDFISKPFGYLVLMYGYKWIDEQAGIFQQILESDDDN